MRLGVTFPIHELGPDPVAIRDYAQAVEALGCSHIAVYDHVIGAAPEAHPDWALPYTVATTFHEPLVLLAYIAACTSHIGLVPAVLALPQRQTVLVAKQTAELDGLSGGRLRVGIGVGRYAIESEALGVDFHTRGRRMEEQVGLLRALWSEREVTVHGRWHHISAAGINPLPVQRPIPLWFGGGGRSEAGLQRVARLADGLLWYLPALPSADPLPARTIETVGRLRRYAQEAGRDPASLGLEGQMSVALEEPEVWRQTRDTWAALGADYLVLNTMHAGFTSVQQHVGRLRQAMEALR